MLVSISGTLGTVSCLTGCLSSTHVLQVPQELHSGPSLMLIVISVYHIISYKAIPKFSHTTIRTVNYGNDSQFRHEETEAYLEG